MKRIIFRYGLLSGLILTILGLFSWFCLKPFLGYRMSEVYGYASIIIGLMTIPMAIQYYKTTLTQEAIGFGDALKIGFGISTITSSFMYIYTALLFTFAGNDFMQWAEKGMPKEEWVAMQAQLAQMPAFVMSPWFQGLVMFLTVFIIGIVVTLISAYVLSRQAKAVDTI